MAEATPHLSGDLLDYYTALQYPTQDTFSHFRFLRTASTGIRDAVDHQMQNPSWMASWRSRAIEFRNDLAPGAALLPGAQVDAGLFRMISLGLYAELSVGMREFATDENMQVAIMGMLRLSLGFMPQNPLQSVFNRANAEAGGMRRMVAQSMRYHRSNAILQHDACRILSYMPEPNVALSVALRDYVIESLVSAMRDFPTDQVLQRKCLISIENITRPMQNPLFFMVGTHNMLLVVFECMQNHPVSHPIVSLGAVLLARFIINIGYSVASSAVTDQQAFAGCDIAQMQNFLLRRTDHFSMDHQITIWNLMSLSYLVGVFPAQMPEQENNRCLGTITRALMIHAEHEEVVENAMHLIAALLPNFWCPQTGVANTPSAKTLMPIHSIVPLLVSALRVAQSSATTKPICTSLFQLLCVLSQNHASNTQFIAECRALDILTITYRDATVPQLDQEWEVQRGLLQTMLASFVAAPAQVGN